jgi:hypothetical protein
LYGPKKYFAQINFVDSSLIRNITPNYFFWLEAAVDIFGCVKAPLDFHVCFQIFFIVNSYEIDAASSQEFLM